jgi:choline dehydrogenase-like flavoprotein
MGLTPSQPNIGFLTTECYGGPKQYNQFPGDGQHAFSIIAELFAPKSRGAVTLASKDPNVNPVIDCNYLADPLDMLVLSEACRYANEIVTQGAGTKDIVAGSWPPDQTHHLFQTREDWVPYVKQHATTCMFLHSIFPLSLPSPYFKNNTNQLSGYHASGTCAMGPATDSNAVLDNKLRVRGVKDLRVADCSVMPTLHGGHTQMPAYGIGERCADFIKETWVL